MKILKMEIEKDYFSILIEDQEENITFWIDCSLSDEYGKKDDNGNFIDWEFNQYIFYDYNEQDQKAKEYQENSEKVEQLIYFIEENEQELVKKYKEERLKHYGK